MSLVTSELGFAYARGGTPVLDRVAARFEPGRVTAVVGPNGSGKTTLLRLLLGVIEPTGGSATLDGTPTCRLRGQELSSRIAYVAQRSSVAGPFTVRQVVGLGVAPGVEARSREAWVQRSLEEQDLAERAADLYAHLSAGQQQRAALARAAVQLRGGSASTGTRCLLADEPIAAMDPAHAQRAMGFLRALACEGTGCAVVVVLHDFTLAARFADDALVLDANGRVAASGPVHAALEPSVLESVFGTRFVRVGIEAGRSATSDDDSVLVPVLGPRARGASAGGANVAE